MTIITATSSSGDTMRHFLAALAVAIGLGAAAPALAAPVTYTVPTSALTNGGTISGTIVYDDAAASGSQLISVDLVETGAGAGTFTFNGSQSTGGFFAQATAVATVNVTRVAYFQLNSIAAGGASFTARIFTSACAQETGGKCVSVYGGNNTGIVTVTPMPAAAAVPTLSEWAMILFGTILAGGAALYIQRRRQFS